MNLKSKALYFLLVVGVLAALVVPAFAVENARAGIPLGADAVIYVTDDSLQVWAPTAYDDHWNQVLYLSETTAEELADAPETPILLDSSEDGFYALYKLPSNEYQVMVGPNPEGKVEVAVLDENFALMSLSEFNVHEIEQ